MARPPGPRRPGRRAGLAFALALAFALVVGAPAQAQQTPPASDDPADRARVRIGPFYLQTWLMLTDAGLDTNVFNDAEGPKEDYTFTLTPGIDGGMRAGAARLSVRVATNYIWYRTYKSEQGIDTATRAQFELRYNRLRPYVAADWAHTRSRSGYEIDARAERSVPTYEAGADLKVASRTWLAVSYRRVETGFVAGESYDGVPLDSALDNVSDSASAGLKFELSPFTTLSLNTQRQSARFDVSTFRDTESWVFQPALEFSPDALLSGRAAVGYRLLDAKFPGTPDFSGVVAGVGLRYTPLSATAFGVSVERDVAYSYEAGLPYYVQTGAAFSVTQHIIGPLEVGAQGRRTWLAYRALEGVGATRTDTFTSYGGGIGYRIGAVSRVGLDVEEVERRSPLPRRSYRGTRVFTSVRYGL